MGVKHTVHLTREEVVDRSPRYRIGQTVSCCVRGHKWQGVIYKVADAGDDIESTWEYWVTNAPDPLSIGHPLLAWEHEMFPVDRPERN